jgi:hypothetical protein
MKKPQGGKPTDLHTAQAFPRLSGYAVLDCMEYVEDIEPISKIPESVK